jgi:hypothetical protein
VYPIDGSDEEDEELGADGEADEVALVSLFPSIFSPCYGSPH